MSLTPDIERVLGFIGPLPEADQDRCPLCGDDPLDVTIHASTCATVVLNLCGVMQVGKMCMAGEHMPTDHDWDQWRTGHKWVPLDDCAAHLAEQVAALVERAGEGSVRGCRHDVKQICEDCYHGPHASEAL